MRTPIHLDRENVIGKDGGLALTVRIVKKIIRDIRKKRKKPVRVSSGSSTPGYVPDRDPEDGIRTLLSEDRPHAEGQFYRHLLDTLDFDGYRRIQKEFRNARWRKYLDLQRCLPGNFYRALDLDLDKAPRSRVLDLGSGAGHFGLACRYFGHDYTGMNTPDEMFEAVNDFFGLRFVRHTIMPFEPLPFADERFDFITSYAANFFLKKNGRKYGSFNDEEWKYFFSQVQRIRSDENSTIALNLNRFPQGLETFSESFSEFARREGATIDRENCFVYFRNKVTS